MKKHKLTDMKLNSVDLVKRGANQEAHIVFHKSDNTPDETDRNVLKKAFDYLKQLFADEEPEKLTKSDVVEECIEYTGQLLKSFDSIIGNTEMDADKKTAMMQKSVQEFAGFMTEAVPLWANSQSVAKSDNLSNMIAKAEIPEVEEKRKESGDMSLANLSPEEQATYKSLLAKINGEKPEEKKEVEEPVKTEKSAPVEKSEAIPEFVKKALDRSEEFIKAQELKEQKEIAKKYEVLGEKADELGQHLFDLKKSNEEIYKSSIAMLDRQVDAIEKSGIFTEIGKSGSTHNDGDVIAKAEGLAKEIRKSAPDMTHEQAMAKVWETHPDLMAEYESGR